MPESPWRQIWESCCQEFLDLPDLQSATRLITRLVIAALLSGFLGYTRQKKGKEAGLRTHMLVGVGAALFIVVSCQVGMKPADLSRVVQGIITGLGFLGAGAILKLTDKQEILG